MYTIVSVALGTFLFEKSLMRLLVAKNVCFGGFCIFSESFSGELLQDLASILLAESSSASVMSFAVMLVRNRKIV